MNLIVDQMLPGVETCLYYGRHCDINAIRKLSDAQFKKFTAKMAKEQEEHIREMCGEPPVGRPGYVYVAVANYFVKIGVTGDVRGRIRGLNSGSPHPVDLLRHWHCEDAQGVERQLHEKYKKFRKQGEWFKLPGRKIEELLQSNFS